MFQYPLRVEWCWNVKPAILYLIYYFRFSTLYGSNGVGTRYPDHKAMRIVFRFSTLYGSNGVGTDQLIYSTNSQLLFQYPLRVEWCWNTVRPQHPD